MQNELDIVRDVSRRLEQGGLAYMLTGSMAMNYYAQPRMTRDIDLVVALAPQDTDTVGPSLNAANASLSRISRRGLSARRTSSSPSFGRREIPAPNSNSVMSGIW